MLLDDRRVGHVRDDHGGRVVWKPFQQDADR
jgi:hypothetical protein